MIRRRTQAPLGQGFVGVNEARNHRGPLAELESFVHVSDIPVVRPYPFSALLSYRFQRPQRLENIYTYNITVNKKVR